MKVAGKPDLCKSVLVSRPDLKLKIYEKALLLKGFLLCTNVNWLKIQMIDILEGKVSRSNQYD